jgi:hypothetical protein
MALEIAQDLALVDDVAALNEQGIQYIRRGGTYIHEATLRLDPPEGSDRGYRQIFTRRRGYRGIGVPPAGELQERNTDAGCQQQQRNQPARAWLQSI